ncbi:MAG: zinc-binding dehydrogenase, partial [Ilumatobacteraceae bacterium]
VTSRSESKRAQALDMGAAAAHDSAAPKWAVEADVVVESVGPATWDQSVRSLKPGGRLVVCGSTSGPKVELTLPRLFFKQFEIIGSTMGSYQEFDEVCALVDAGVAITIDGTHPLADYQDALARLEQGEQLGKIVLTHESS